MCQTGPMDKLDNRDSPQHDFRLLAAGITWLVVTLAYLSPLDPGQWGAGRWSGLAAALLFAAAIFAATRSRQRKPALALQQRYAALVVAALALLVMVLAHPRDIIFILAIIFAAVTPEYFPLRRAAWLQIALHSTLSAAYMWRWGGSVEFLMENLLWLGFQAFALLSSQIAADERRAREELEFSHHQLAATQAMLASTSRQDERLRISRDIHDVMGHHLTGLSLQLEVASHSGPEKAQEHIAQAQLIAKLLLSDVRQVVNDLRAIDVLDLHTALRSLTANTGQLQVTLDLPETLQVEDTRVAEALFRAVQEIVTNAVRHAGARHLQVELQVADGAVIIEARDDGGLQSLPQEGNGLRGMRERIEALGGELQLHAQGGLGYRIHLEAARP